MLYAFLQEEIHVHFDVLHTYKETEEKTIRLLRHRESGERFIFRDFTGTAETYRRLLSIECPYLPKIWEAAEEGGRVLVLEEYLTGNRLDGVIAEALLSEKDTRKIALDVCRALYVLHGLGIIHRDVKPENILLCEDRAVLLDLDASRTEKEDQKKDTATLGTAGYAAPEQFGISQTDGRADIYALGISMNLMLTGAHPSVRLADGRMGRIISRCIMTQPAKRYQTVKQLMEVLAL
ncbi:MAG: protein kinase [Lachnospiraceae bacterium]|nr:protein kinase [Lachnospiraceae bacterium]